MARILLRVGVFARTLFYPQAWLFEPFSCACAGTALTSPRMALPPFLEAVKLRGERHIGGVGKKWLAQPPGALCPYRVAAGNRLVPRRNAGSIPRPIPRTFVGGTSDTASASAPRLSCHCVP